MLKIARVKVDDAYTFIDARGAQIGDRKWVEADQFREGFARVKDCNGKWGHINTKGEPIGMGMVWADVRQFSEGMAAVATSDGKWGHINGKDGKLIGAGGACWKSVGNFKEGFARVQRDGALEWGFIDVEGKLMERCWREVGDFSGGFARVLCDGEVDGMLEWGHISKDGKLFDAQWMEVGDFIGGFAKAKGHQGWGFIDHSGRMLNVGGCWQEVGNFREGFVRVKSSRGWTHCDTSGLSFEMGGCWNEVGDFHNGFSKVCGVRGWSHVDTEGLPFPNILWHDVGDFKKVTLANGNESAFARVRGQHGEGHIDREGQWCWRDVADFHEKFDVNAEGDHGWGYINPDGFTFKNIVWKEVGDFCENFARAKGKHGWGHLNTEGVLLKAVDNWLEAKDFKSGLAVVKASNGNWGFIDQNGSFVSSPEWKEIGDFVSVLPTANRQWELQRCTIA